MVCFGHYGIQSTCINIAVIHLRMHKREARHTWTTNNSSLYTKHWPVVRTNECPSQDQLAFQQCYVIRAFEFWNVLYDLQGSDVSKGP